MKVLATKLRELPHMLADNSAMHAIIARGRNIPLRKQKTSRRRKVLEMIGVAIATTMIIRKVMGPKEAGK